MAVPGRARVLFFVPRFGGSTQEDAVGCDSERRLSVFSKHGWSCAVQVRQAAACVMFGCQALRVLLNRFWVDEFRFVGFLSQVDEAYARLPGSDVLDLGTEGARRWAEAREAYDRR